MVSILPYRDGWRGSEDALAAMGRIVRNGLGLERDSKTDEALLDLCSDILVAATARTELDRIRVIHDFVINTVIYLPDPAGGHERIQYPLETIDRGAGDCDDLAVLEAELLGMAGFDVIDFEAARYEETDGNAFQHVYIVLGVSPDVSPTGYIYLDPTVPDKPAGWGARAPYTEEPLEVAHMPVLMAEVGLEVAGWLDQLVQTGVQVGSQYAQSRQNSSGSGSERALRGKAFDDAAREVTVLLNRIQSKPIVTLADFNQASAAVNVLANIAAEHGATTPYILEQWESAHYRPAYEQRLAQIAQAANESGLTGDVDGDGEEDSESIVSGSGSLATAALLLVAGIFISKAL